MQILIAWLVVSAAAVQTLPLALTPQLTRSDPVLVRQVIDGDTIDVGTLGRVRLLGIDAPEINRGFDTAAPFAHEARDRLLSLVSHRWVRLEQEGAAFDAYNRRLAYVIREDGVFVNAALVRDGLARVSARLPLMRLDELKRAEAEAQAFRRGMWGATPTIPATGYTRRSTRGHSPRVRTSKPRTRGKRHKSKTMTFSSGSARAQCPLLERAQKRERGERGWVPASVERRGERSRRRGGASRSS